MKATIDFDDVLYRRLKIEAARRGQTIRELVAEGVRHVIDAPVANVSTPPAEGIPPWFGALRKYAVNAHGKHDMADVRASIARGRAGEDW